jgi:uncharacterized protein
MQLDNTFAVTAPLGEVWETLMDFERVAGCVPGASVVARTEDTFDVTMRVKLGPILMQYKGTLEVVERNAAARRAVVRGKAQELKGQGTAEGNIELRLAEDGEVTRGTCSADIKLSGRAAAMGKGVISKVAEQLMVQFALNLQALLNGSPTEADPGADPSVPERSGATVVEGVETLAAGTDSKGVLRDPEEATPLTAPVEQVGGDPAMTQGRRGSPGGKAGHGHDTAQGAPAAARAGGDPGVPERSGATVVEGVETLAAGTDSEGVLRDPEEATPHTAPVEQVEGDRAMTEGRRGNGAGGGTSTEVPATRMPEASVSGGAQSSPAARVSDRVSGSGQPHPVAGGRGASAEEPEALDALALVRSLVGAQLRQPRVILGLLVPAGVLAGILLGRRSARH